MSRILLIRHGRTEWNTQGRFQGATDIALDEIGRSQAVAAARTLAQIPVSMVVSSDLSRALETAQIIAAEHGVSVQTDERLRERAYGPWEGLTRSQIEEQYPDDFLNWKQRLPMTVVGIEPPEQVGARGGQSLRDIASKLGADETAIISSHGGTSRQAIADFLGWTSPQSDTIFGLDNCHWADIRNIHGDWRLHGYNISARDIS